MEWLTLEKKRMKIVIEERIIVECLQLEQKKTGVRRENRCNQGKRQIECKAIQIWPQEIWWNDFTMDSSGMPLKLPPWHRQVQLLTRTNSRSCCWNFIWSRVDERQLWNCCRYAKGTVWKEPRHDWRSLRQNYKTPSCNLKVYVPDIIVQYRWKTFTHLCWRRCQWNADPVDVEIKTTKECVTWVGEDEVWKWRPQKPSENSWKDTSNLKKPATFRWSCSTSQMNHWTPHIF